MPGAAVGVVKKNSKRNRLGFKMRLVCGSETNWSSRQ